MRRIIFSVYQDTLKPEANQCNFIKTVQWLRDRQIPFRMLLQYSKSTKRGEEAFEVRPVSLAELGDVLRYAESYNQECVVDLYTNEARTLYLASLSSERVGKYTEVSKEAALKQYSYSYDVAADKYYTIDKGNL